MAFSRFGSALKLQAKEAERCSYPLRLDVYGGGCDHDCSYCYARAQMIGFCWNNSKNRSHPFPRVVDKECQRALLVNMPNRKPKCVSGPWKRLRPLLQNRLPLRIGAVTDCFQRYMEGRAHAGLDLLKLLTEAKYPAQIVTKSDLIGEDAYINAMRENRDNLIIQFSITTASDQTSSRLEPRAPVSSKRIKALTRLVGEGFYTGVRINPLFPIYPDKTLTGLHAQNGLRGEALLENARNTDTPSLSIFDMHLVDKVSKVFNVAPQSTLGRHTLIAGFVRLPHPTVRWVSEALGWQKDDLKAFFGRRIKNCYYYTSEEVRHYYEAIQERCKKNRIPFSICYDSDENYESFRDMWANRKDCCNALNNVPGFQKVYRDCCQSKSS